MRAGTAVVLIVLCVLLLGIVAAMVSLWTGLGGLPMSGHGWAALIGGGLLAFAVGAGLMALMFHSARKGYDDDASG